MYSGSAGLSLSFPLPTFALLSAGVGEFDNDSVPCRLRIRPCISLILFQMRQKEAQTKTTTTQMMMEVTAKWYYENDRFWFNVVHT